MFVTTEVRWFYEGARPNDVVAWFQALGPPPDEQAPRTDYYLHPTDAALNVKLREGHAEAKRRDGAVGALVSLADEQTGLIERWHKWSFPLAAGAIGAVATNAYWQPVRKQRWMRVYRVAEDVVEEITDATEGTSGPCTVELSHLTMDGQDWWSLCVEASGAHAEQSLHRTAAHIFSPEAAPPLHATASMGYAAWLLRHMG